VVREQASLLLLVVTVAGGLAAEGPLSEQPSATVAPYPSSPLPITNCSPLPNTKWLTHADRAWFANVRGRSKDEVWRRFGRPDHIAREPDGEECWWYPFDGWWKGVSFRNGVAQGECFSHQTGVEGGFGSGGIGLP
jgi:hypothetical protein